MYSSDKINYLIEKKYIDNLEFPNILNKAKIDTGFRCNASCYYCYYKNNLDDSFMNTDEIYYQIDKAKEFGFNKIELSGGETSIHPDFINIIKYSSLKNLKVSTLSNCIIFKNRSILDEAIFNGLNEILISVHGLKDTHDNIVLGKNKLEFSPFDNIIELINEEIDVNIRINIIIHKDNIKELKYLFNYFLDTKVSQINLLPLNGWDDASIVLNKNNNIIIDNISYLEEAIDIIKDKIDINLRYFPYCKINKKYHKYIKTVYHHFFDEDDWNPLLTFKEDYSIYSKEHFKDPLRLETYKNTLLNNRINSQFYKIRNKENCLNCEFDNICDGFKK